MNLFYYYLTLVTRYDITCTDNVMVATIFLSGITFCNALFCSWQQSVPYCTARVIQQTCNESSADINVLKTVFYNAKFSNYIHTSCALGEFELFGILAQYTKRYSTDGDIRTIYSFKKQNVSQISTQYPYYY